MVESAPLLREYTLIAYRGFESLSLRHNQSDPERGRFGCGRLQVFEPEKSNNPVRAEHRAAVRDQRAAQRRRSSLSLRHNQSDPERGRFGCGRLQVFEPEKSNNPVRAEHRAAVRDQRAAQRRRSSLSLRHNQSDPERGRFGCGRLQVFELEKSNNPVRAEHRAAVRDQRAAQRRRSSLSLRHNQSDPERGRFGCGGSQEFEPGKYDNPVRAEHRRTTAPASTSA